MLFLSPWTWSRRWKWPNTDTNSEVMKISSPRTQVCTPQYATLSWTVQSKLNLSCRTWPRRQMFNTKNPDSLHDWSEKTIQAVPESVYREELNATWGGEHDEEDGDDQAAVGPVLSLPEEHLNPTTQWVPVCALVSPINVRLSLLHNAILEFYRAPSHSLDYKLFLCRLN